jgi:hypothetical protein
MLSMPGKQKILPGINATQGMVEAKLLATNVLGK